MSKQRHSRRLRAAAAGLCLALVASACGGSGAETTTAADAPAATESATEAQTGLPQLVGDTVAGAQLDTNDLQGQDVVVWFWAPW